jgi:hypothetical protein
MHLGMLYQLRVEQLRLHTYLQVFKKRYSHMLEPLGGHVRQVPG